MSCRILLNLTQSVCNQRNGPVMYDTGNCHSVVCKPLVHLALTEGQTATLQSTQDGCCFEYVICDKSQCPSQPTQCSSPMVLQKLETSDACCMMSQCGKLYFYFWCTLLN